MDRRYKTLSHVGICASDMEVSVRWYTECLGCKEAFRLHKKDGSLWIVYLNLTPTTFIELFVLGPNQKPGPSAHFAIEVTDLDDLVAEVKQRMPAESIRKPDILTAVDGARQFNMWDPDGNRLEFMEFGPESLQYKAMQRIAQEQAANKE
jgi:lactoylglutathione lyase